MLSKHQSVDFRTLASASLEINVVSDMSKMSARIQKTCSARHPKKCKYFAKKNASLEKSAHSATITIQVHQKAKPTNSKT